MKWVLDPSHTSLHLAVKHMGVFTVRGAFKRVQGTVETDEEGRPKAIESQIDAASIDTAEPKRDAHLRSPDFLDAERYPTLTFRSTTIRPLADGRYRVTGDLTIRDKTRPVTFEAEAAPPVKDYSGGLRAGATASGKVNRKEWGLHWNQVLDLGTLLVGEEVIFTLDVQGVAAASAPAAA